MENNSLYSVRIKYVRQDNYRKFITKSSGVDGLTLKEAQFHYEMLKLFEKYGEVTVFAYPNIRQAIFSKVADVLRNTMIAVPDQAEAERYTMKFVYMYFGKDISYASTKIIYKITDIKIYKDEIKHEFVDVSQEFINNRIANKINLLDLMTETGICKVSNGAYYPLKTLSMNAIKEYTRAIIEECASYAPEQRDAMMARLDEIKICHSCNNHNQ